MAADPKPLEKWCGPSGAYVVFSDADLFAALDLERPGLDEARALAAEGRFPEAYSAWGRYWARREDPRWVFDPARWPDAIRRKMPWAVAVFRNLADRVVAHDLGGGPYQAVPRGRFVDWALDNGDTAYIGFHYFFWFPPLSRAYLLTGDEKYARAFVDVLCSWYDALPGIRNFDGVVWNRQLGSSLRATYFLEAYYCLRESASLTPELHEKLLKILLGHARYVHDVHMQQYTEWNGQNTGCAMLACLGSLLPEFRESGRWKDAAVPMLRRHILENFLPDGGHQELCMQYHVAGLRDLSLGARALRAAGDDRILSDPRLRARLREAFAWPLKVAFPSGFTPALNSGVVDKEWLTYMALGADLFDDAEFRWAARRFAGEQYLPVSKAISPALWQVDETVAGALHFREGGAMALREADEHVAGAVPSGEGGVAPSYRSVLLPDSGFAVLRAGWEPESMCLVLDFGTPWGGHGYPGKLSFTFWAYDALLAALPGSPASYSLPVYAEWCRQTRSQNTVLVGDRSPEPPFTARLESWHNLEDAVFVSASTEVYRPVRHVRAITFVPGGYFVVFDSLTGGPAGTPLSWLFHCPPGLTRGEGAAFASPAGGMEPALPAGRCLARRHRLGGIPQDSGARRQRLRGGGDPVPVVAACRARLRSAGHRRGRTGLAGDRARPGRLRWCRPGPSPVPVRRAGHPAMCRSRDGRSAAVAAPRRRARHRGARGPRRRFATGGGRNAAGDLRRRMWDCPRLGRRRRARARRGRRPDPHPAVGTRLPVRDHRQPGGVRPSPRRLPGDRRPLRRRGGDTCSLTFTRIRFCCTTPGSARSAAGRCPRNS